MLPFRPNSGKSFWKPSAARLWVCASSCTRAERFGQEIAEFFPSLAPRHEGLVAGEQQAEVVAQSAVDGVLKFELQDLRSGFAFRLAAGETDFAIRAERWKASGAEVWATRLGAASSNISARARNRRCG